MLVFTCHVIKPKTCNHSMNKVANKGYDRWQIYIHLRQQLGLCCLSFARYLEKCFIQIYRALYGDAMLVPLSTWLPKSNRNICCWVLVLKRNLITLEFQYIEGNISSSARSVQLAKTKAISFFDPCDRLLREPFKSRNAKAWKFWKHT